MVNSYHHRKLKGLADLKKAVKSMRNSFILVDKWTNQIVTVVQGGTCPQYDKYNYMCYQTDWRKEKWS